MTKPCARCAKQIPEVALDCVFCGARQPEVADAEGRTEKGPGPLLGANTAEIDAVVGSAVTETPAQTRPTQAMPAIASAVEVATDAATDVATESGAERGELRAQPGWAAQLPFERLARVLLSMGGLLLIGLFALPWNGTGSLTLLETLDGAAFVRQFFYLAGGMVLFSTGVLPLPTAFRSILGVGVAMVPLVVAGGALSGWRGALAALVVLCLPAAHLVHAREHDSRPSRILLGGAILAVAVLYLAPSGTISPIVAVFRLLTSGSVGLLVLGAFALVPLGLASLSLLGLLGRDLPDVDLLLSIAIVTWSPIVVAVRGLLVDDRTQVLIAFGVLVPSTVATVCLAQLLARMAHGKRGG